MKKVVVSIIITALVMLVIGNGLGLVYLSYKCDKADEEITELKLALASNGIVNKTSDNISTNDNKNMNGTDSNDMEGQKINIEDSELPQADKVEKIEDNEKYKEYVEKGMEHIDEIAKELPDYYAIMALQEITNCDFQEIIDVNFENDSELAESESKEIWNDMISNLPKEVFEIMNSDRKIDSKINEIKKYGYLAYPVMKNINDNLKDDEKIKYSDCEVEVDFTLKEKNKIKEYLSDCDLTSKEKSTLIDYIEYEAD